MRILLTGGGSGGHFYPLIAVAEEIIEISKDNRLLPPDIYFASTDAYDEKALFDLDIEFIKIPAGKRRTYFSIKNYLDLFKIGWGVLIALWKVFKIYPDVVFAKGGYASFPTLFAARILRIPVIIHESDSVPGRVSLWAAKFAQKIAIGFEGASKYFDKEKVAYTGNPVRKEIVNPARSGAREYLKLEENIPVAFIIGGSQGAQIINETIIQALPQLLSKYQVIHQVGNSNLDYVVNNAKVVLRESSYSERYKVFGFLNSLAMRMSAGAANVVVSRSGAGAIAEISNWGIPSIIIPITESNGDHQKENAYNFARSGGAVVIEEKNLTPNIIISEIDRIISDQKIYEEMSKGAQEFAIKDSAKIIAEAVIELALSHEKE